MQETMLTQRAIESIQGTGEGKNPGELQVKWRG
jgi:hypothetical protein